MVFAFTKKITLNFKCTEFKNILDVMEARNSFLTAVESIFGARKSRSKRMWWGHNLIVTRNKKKNEIISWPASYHQLQTTGLLFPNLKERHKGILSN